MDNYFMIGTSQANMINIESLWMPIIAPKPTFTKYQKSIALASGLVRGVGLPSATWHWDYMTSDERAQLRIYCSEKSSTVYIQTPTNENSEFEIYTAVMVWPEGEDPTIDIFLDFTIEFMNLVWVADMESV